ncbi:serine/threonine protein kinase [Candidatus Uabimicrobium amorphum]|uniref:Protein kinase n=1 Tax=Uabimicrobium amorphum TaxID=2596890 RepID=A0A5S9IW71_UABAM|nr:serine/threonine-protein kinase [Candidatus Uabimicrobium amorphum]BBM87675.1 protein kinase [Candidatus Uabimicrobium amorphum]
MQKFSTYNTYLAKKLKEQDCVAMNLLVEGLRYCNEHERNLGEYILDKKWVTVLEYVEIMHSLHEYIPSQMKFDKYFIVRELGRGGMGVVYLVVREDSTRLLVLKTLLHCDRDYIRRFYKEARGVSTLQHANIVPIYDFGQQKGIPYFTMKYIEGIDFEQFLKANRDKIDVCIDILVTISKAVDYIHQKNIVHRDIKPANILLDKNFTPYLADFGLVKLPGQATLTKDGDILGTIHYTSPEQARGVKNLSSKADVYSLGVLLYEVLTGKTPFADHNMIAAYRKVIKSIPPEPQKYASSIPDALNQICVRAMNRNPQKRFNAMEFATALQKYKDTPNLPKYLKYLYRGQRWFFSKGWLIISSVVVIFSAVFLGWQQYSPSPQWYNEYITDSLEDAKRGKKLLSEAKKLVEHNDFAQAYPILQQAQKLDPNNVDVPYYLALCLEKQQKYSQSIEYLTQCIAFVPWEAKYFKKRGEVFQKAKRHDEGIYDFLRCIELDPLNIFAVENIYDMALSGTSPKLLFTVKQVFKERSFLQYTRRRVDLFQQQKNKLCTEIMQNKFLHYAQQPTTKSQIKKFIDRFFEQHDPEPKKSAFKAMLLHPKTSIAYIDDLLATTHKVPTKKLLRLREDLRKHYIENMRVFILRTIVTYVQLQRKHGLRKLYSWRKDVFGILREIICDKNENEIIRYYAAEIFFELDLVKAFTFTTTVLHSDDLNVVFILKSLAREYQNKLLQLEDSSVTVRESKLYVNEQEIAVDIGEEIIAAQVMPFIKVKAIKCVHSQSILQQLIAPAQSPFVRLHALAKMNVNTDQKAYEILSYFLNCDDEHQRGFALNLLTPQMPSYELKLLRAMQDRSSLVRSVAISGITADCSPKIFVKLREYLKEESDLFLRLQCVLRLSPDHFLKDILVNANENIIVRFATMFYFSKKKNFKTKDLGVLQHLMSDDNKIMRFFITFSLMRRKFGAMTPMVLAFMNNKDYYSRLGIAMSTSPDLVSRLRSYALHAPEKRVRDVALVSLVTIYINNGFHRIQNRMKKTGSLDLSNAERFFPELNELHNICEKKNEKEWLSFGYRHFLYDENYEIEKIHASMRDEFNADHAAYLQRLLNKVLIEDQLTVFRINFLSFRAMIVDDGSLRKLERSALAYGIFKRAPSPKQYQECLDILRGIEHLQPIQRYWLADLHFSQKEYAAAKKAIDRAIADEPWNVQFLRLRNEVNRQNN